MRPEFLQALRRCEIFSSNYWYSSNLYRAKGPSCSFTQRELQEKEILWRVGGGEKWRIWIACKPTKIFEKCEANEAELRWTWKRGQRHRHNEELLNQLHSEGVIDEAGNVLLLNHQWLSSIILKTLFLRWYWIFIDLNYAWMIFNLNRYT